MATFIMVYTSMTGNTEMMANAIAEGIREAGHEIKQLDSYDAHASDVLPYDGILVGTFTWGSGDLPDEMLDFYGELFKVDLTGKKAVVFGSYDSLYGDDGMAVDTMIETLRKRGANVVADGFKIELTPSPEQLEECKGFGKWFTEQFTPVQNI